MARTATTKTGNGSDNHRAFAEIGNDMEAQIAALREDIGRLAETVSSAGSAFASEMKDSAQSQGRKLQKTSQAHLKDLRAQIDEIEARVSGQVRERPVTALAAAAGVGFLVALLARR